MFELGGITVPDDSAHPTSLERHTSTLDTRWYIARVGEGIKNGREISVLDIPRIPNLFSLRIG